MKHSSTLEDTRIRLKHWGQWSYIILTMNLGLSRKSILGQLIDVKGTLIKNTAPTLAPDNQEAEEIDRLVNQLAQYNAKQAKIICIHYVTRDTIEKKIAKANLTKSSYFRNLSTAERWIDGYLGLN